MWQVRGLKPRYCKDNTYENYHKIFRDAIVKFINKCFYAYANYNLGYSGFQSNENILPAVTKNASYVGKY